MMPNKPISGPGPTNTPVDAALLERWALFYLGRYASSAENLRRVLRRRVRRRLGDEREALPEIAALIDALVERYRGVGLLDDMAYATGRARGELSRGRSMRQITAGLRAKGVDMGDATSVITGLREEHGDLDLVAACAFARRRRLGPFRREPAERQRELAAFARAGFSRRVAAAVFACADEAAIDALLGEGATR